MKISIIIPVYNSEKYLNKILDSITNQTYKNYEVIAINDGSNDGSEKILKLYSEKFQNIKYYNQENMGPGMARRNGFLRANGDLLFFIDSDDYIYDIKALEKINKAFEDNNIDILFFNFIAHHNNNDTIENTLRNTNMQEGIYSIKKLKKRIIGGGLWTKIFIKNKMKEEYFYNATNFEDYYTTYLYLNNCDNFYYLKETIIFSYRDRDSSLSNVNARNINIDRELTSIKICNIIYKKSKLKKATGKLLVDTIFSVRKKYIINKGNRNKINSSDILKIDNEISKIKFSYLDIGIKNIIKIILYNFYIYFNQGDENGK